MDEVWVSGEDGPLWAHREVSTKVRRGHFGTIDPSEGQGVEEAISHGGREAADRRGDVGAGRVGGACGAGAWSKCQPGVSLATAVSTRVAGRGEYRDGETVAGSRDRATVSKANRAVRRQATRRTTVAAGAIHVELPKGHLRITGRVDAEAVRVVLEQLLG